mgnify:CR=1 FL=1
MPFYGGGCQNILSPSTGYPSFCIRRPPLLLSRTGSGLIDLSAQPGSGSCARRALVDHRGGSRISDSMLRWFPDLMGKDGSHEEAAGLFRGIEGKSCT